MITQKEYDEINKNEAILKFESHPNLAFDYYSMRVNNHELQREERLKSLLILIKKRKSYRFLKFNEEIMIDTYFDLLGDLDWSSKVSALSLTRGYLDDEDFAYVMEKSFDAIRRLHKEIYPLYLGNDEYIKLMETIPEKSILNIYRDLENIFTNEKGKVDKIVNFIDMIKKIEQSNKMLDIFKKIDISFFKNAMIYGNNNFVGKFFELRHYYNKDIAQALLKFKLELKILSGADDIVVVNAFMSNDFIISYEYFKRLNKTEDFFYDVKGLKKHNRKIAIHLKDELVHTIWKNHKEETLIEEGVYFLNENEISIINDFNTLILIKEGDLFKVDVMDSNGVCKKRDFFNYIKKSDIELCDKYGFLYDDVFEMIALNEMI